MKYGRCIGEAGRNSRCLNTSNCDHHANNHAQNVGPYKKGTIGDDDFADDDEFEDDDDEGVYMSGSLPDAEHGNGHIRERRTDRDTTCNRQLSPTPALQFDRNNGRRGINSNAGTSAPEPQFHRHTTRRNDTIHRNTGTRPTQAPQSHRDTTRRTSEVNHNDRSSPTGEVQSERHVHRRNDGINYNTATPLAQESRVDRHTAQRDNLMNHDNRLAPIPEVQSGRSRGDNGINRNTRPPSPQEPRSGWYDGRNDAGNNRSARQFQPQADPDTEGRRRRHPNHQPRLQTRDPLNHDEAPYNTQPGHNNNGPYDDCNHTDHTLNPESNEDAAPASYLEAQVQQQGQQIQPTAPADTSFTDLRHAIRIRAREENHLQEIRRMYATRHGAETTSRLTAAGSAGSESLQNRGGASTSAITEQNKINNTNTQRRSPGAGNPIIVIDDNNDDDNGMAMAFSSVNRAQDRSVTETIANTANTGTLTIGTTPTAVTGDASAPIPARTPARRLIQQPPSSSPPPPPHASTMNAAAPTPTLAPTTPQTASADGNQAHNYSPPQPRQRESGPGLGRLLGSPVEFDID